ncbi:MAG: 1,6-dihydroxycyclohexa-2,4-diene-1-carboxylate dehydrogenase [Micrococcus sp.]|nr:1,6-dihydroxycyclohexa-2,4-diene-1-carboxylate dehydrogenase [Micrococcus sp.]
MVAPYAGDVLAPGRFAGQVAVVTGSAQGIGRKVAERIAAEGGAVVLVDRADLVHEVAREITDDAGRTGSGGSATAVTADLETFAGAVEAVEAAVSTHGRVDVLVNNVGGTIWARPYEEYDEDRIEREIRRSLFPTLWSCRAVLPTMLEQGSGVIVNVSSVATRGMNRVPYAAAKGGVNALTQSLAMEVAGRGVRVVATAPGGTEAPPRKVKRGPEAETETEKAWYQAIVDQTVDSSFVKRYGTLDEQAAPIVFLASREASYLTGSVLPVAGGDLG